MLACALTGHVLNQPWTASAGSERAVHTRRTEKGFVSAVQLFTSIE